MTKKRKNQKSYSQRSKEYELQYRMLVNEYKKRMKEIKQAGKRSNAQNVLLGRITSKAIGKRGDILKRPTSRSVETYRQAIAELERFMRAKTSTLKGVEEVSAGRIKSFRGKYPALNSYTDKEVEDLLEFLGSERGENTKTKYDSDQLVKVLSISNVKEKKDSYQTIMDKIEEKNQTLADVIREFEEKKDNVKDDKFIYL